MSDRYSFGLKTSQPFMHPLQFFPVNIEPVMNVTDGNMYEIRCFQPERYALGTVNFQRVKFDDDVRLQ